MPHAGRFTLTLLLASLPFVAQAGLVRCSTPDGTSKLQRAPCTAPGAVQQAVVATKPLPRQPIDDPLQTAVAAHRSQDWTTARQLLLPLAEQGNALAQMLVGDLYQNGSGVAKDSALAFAWIRKAAEQGYAKAQALLAVMHQEGWGTPKNDAQGAVWLRKAADQHDGIAQMALAMAYLTGRGVSKDESEGMRWVRTAAEGGNADAQVLLGIAYRDGAGGLPKDIQAARLWLRKAAGQGDANAKAALHQIGG